MKLKVEKKELQILGAESKQFSVDTSDTMVIRLLRDKMYKNKIGAVAREIASNSRDANREAGRGNVPVIISIENEIGNLLSDEELSISFKDNGIGISPERMDKIFLKYGSSTKRDTDEFTGGFGIGAKTPFAYTDNFYIETIVEENGKRTKYKYQATISSDGHKEISSMVCLDEKETAEQTGTTIIVPIKNYEDRKLFEKEVVYATSLWDIKPTLIGLELELKTEKVFENDKYIVIYDNESFYGVNKYVALVDGIPYSIQNKSISDKDSNINVSTNYLKFCLKYKTNDVTVSGSREDIEYVNSNLNLIVKDINGFHNQNSKSLTEFKDSAKTFLDACIANTLINLSKYKATGAKYGFGSISDFNGYKKNYILLLGEICYHLEKEQDYTYSYFEGVKTFSSPHFQVLSLDLKKMQNGKMLSNKYASRSVEGELWKNNFYLMDLDRVEPTRNAMLKQINPERYVLVEILDYSESIKGYKSTIKNLSDYHEILKVEFKILELLGVELKRYSEVEKLKTLKEKDKNKTDIVSVNLRIYDNYFTGDRSWKGIDVNFDKKNKKFVNLKEVLIQFAQNNNFEVCYFEKEKLSDFNETRLTDYSSIAGMSREENGIRKILSKNNVVVVGVSSSKVSYFSDYPTMSEKMTEIIKDNKKGKLISDILKNRLFKSLKLNSEYTEQIMFDKKTKVSYDELKEIFDRTEILIKKDSEIKDISLVLSDINLKFMYSMGLTLDEKFMSNLEIVNEFLEKNPMMKFILKTTNKEIGSNYIDTDSEDFKEAILDYFEKQRLSIK
jgi:hypothetical protein